MKIHDLHSVTKKYQIIYADPPWKFTSKKFQDGGRYFDRLESNHYSTMSVRELSKLPIQRIIAEDAACFLWVVDSHLKEGLYVLKHWGFTYKTVAFNWIKTSKNDKRFFNFSPWTLKSWEFVLLGTTGKMGQYKQVNNVKGLVEVERTRHSRKPEEVRNRIDALFGSINKIELFARTVSPGWDSWGNEIL
ncbi:MAG: hypothetical protein EU530_06765 [Promethearchaeota archaeon]|nr:MAG: hypothetical protein EU530_06765 [Candidatus Lokiarchaeota archaeon]